MTMDALSQQFKVLYDQWGAAIANKQYDWFERHFADDFSGTAQPWPTLFVDKAKMIELDKAIEKMDTEWQKVTAQQVSANTVVTIGIVKYNEEEFSDNSAIAEGMPSGSDLAELTHGKSVAYLNGWRHNGEVWQIFDHHMIGIVDDPSA
ncbi:hypothetical protein [Kordiimonas pumila]|uniref:SnoaL-like domain-containing protein n=1 Tax=Kordiimonas pumila TaxID=2161677 RepID=A0ABV7D7K8_9PROT|nr:hypothetical protein [Kordiimonas pumila]